MNEIKEKVLANKKHGMMVMLLTLLGLALAVFGLVMVNMTEEKIPYSLYIAGMVDRKSVV